LIDGLIPGETGLLTERGHRLDQLIDLRVQEMLPVAGLDIFDLIRGGAGVPIFDSHRIGRAMDREAQVIHLARGHEIQGVDRRAEQELVLTA
jgi:hypothetical protein